MQKGTLKWGILGTGLIANSMAKALVESKPNELIAVASRTQKNADAFAKKYNIKKIYQGYEKLLADKDVDVVYISFPNSLHAEWVIKCAEAGKHILCEKPFTVNLAEAKKALAAVAKAKVFCMEAFMYRCHPQTQKIIDLVQENKIGNVHLIEAHFNVSNELLKDTIHVDANLASGGIMDMGGYCVSAARLIAGINKKCDFMQPKKIAGLAYIDKKNVDEYATGILQFDDECFAMVSTSTQFGMYYGLRISGDKGTLTIPKPWLIDQESHIYLELFDGTREKYTVKTDLSLYCHEAETVARFISEGKVQAESPAMSWEDTLGNMQTLDQWREAVNLHYSNEK